MRQLLVKAQQSSWALHCTCKLGRLSHLSTQCIYHLDYQNSMSQKKKTDVYSVQLSLYATARIANLSLIHSFKLYYEYSRKIATKENYRSDNQSRYV